MRSRIALPLIPLPLAAVLGLLVLAASTGSLAQSSLRPSPSPLAPGDGNKPIFDTARKEYDLARIGAKAKETIVAEVDGRAITLPEVADRIRSLPQNIANLPYDVLFPNMVEHLIRREALIVRAHRKGYDSDPDIMRRVRAAADEVLANETIAREAAEGITEAMLLERYRRDYVGKPGPEEVHVRIMLSLTEPEAAGLIAKVKAGEDFAAVAKQFSTDSSASLGGDLGFLPRDGLNVEVGAVAFALPPGGMTAYPVRAPSGWFVVKVEARRAQPTQPYTVVRETIRQAMVREGAFARIKAALADVVVHEYSIAGKEGVGALPSSD